MTEDQTLADAKPMPDWRGFTEAVMEEWQSHCDLDAADKFELALKYNILRPIPGGFDPEEHTDTYCYAEPGDDWYEWNDAHDDDKDATIARLTADRGDWKARYFRTRDERDKAQIASANYANFNHEWRQRAEQAEAKLSEVTAGREAVGGGKVGCGLPCGYDCNGACFTPQADPSCFACEDNPKHPNVPCRICGKGADPVREAAQELAALAATEASKAILKFPQPNYVISKVAEEAGEVVKAAIHCAEGRETPENLKGEIVQTIAMLVRLYVEGDQVHGLPALGQKEPSHD